MLINCPGCHNMLTKAKGAGVIRLVCKHKSCKNYNEIFGTYREGSIKNVPHKSFCGVCGRVIVGAKAFATNGVYHPSCISKILIDKKIRK
jgi:LSD1 subclass zinc finger protein